MQDDLRFKRESVSLMLPLGITIGRYGNIVYFTLASLFVIQLYNQPLSAAGLAIVVVGSVFAGMATAGSSGILTLAMIGIVLGPLGLPVEAVLIIMTGLTVMFFSFTASKSSIHSVADNLLGEISKSVLTKTQAYFCRPSALPVRCPGCCGTVVLMRTRGSRRSSTITRSCCRTMLSSGRSIAAIPPATWS